MHGDTLAAMMGSCRGAGEGGQTLQAHCEVARMQQAWNQQPQQWHQATHEWTRSWQQSEHSAVAAAAVVAAAKKAAAPGEGRRGGVAHL